MTRATILAATAGLVAGMAVWHWAAQDRAPGATLISSAFAQSVKPGSAAATKRQALYWKDPDGKNDFSSEPKKTPDGRDYVPVYEGEEAGFKDEKPAKPQGNRKILYYRNPMGLPDVSSVPKKDSMGMDYVPVYEGDEEDGSTVKIAPGKLQRTGVRSEPVSKRAFGDVDPGSRRSSSRRAPPSGRRAALRCLSRTDWSTSRRAARSAKANL